MEPGHPPAPTYRALLAIPGVGPLAGTLLLARLGGAMWSLALILFVLQRFHSPVLAGITTFVAWMPGLLLSPLGGALMDRVGRVRLIVLDMGVAVLGVVAIVLLSLTGALTVPSLLLVVGASSITGPLTWVGTRSLIPLVVPSPLWERGNALDAITASLTMIAGPALAGLLFAAAGGLATLLAIGGVWLGAGLLVATVRDVPAPRTPAGGVLREALEGLRYVVHNPVLRGLAVLMSLANAGDGIFQVALPVLFRSFPRGGSAVAGAVWSVFGVASVLGALAGGRMATRGRERRIILATLLMVAAAYCVVAAAPLVALPLVAAAAGMAVAGVFVGLHDIAMFSLRQRAIEPAWLGRAMSVSMSVNAVGLPVGTALAGPLVQVSLVGAMAAAAGVVALAAGLCPLLLPAGVARARA
ncbi:MFS transporter [Candidatus Nephthysia bennettiae]|uniref:MFS transporter n=1 Tax=Candidatus Nephthysia bennettiae TaxID=3127016 RepID=A0A934K4Q9_9BACT|nr:MFS transporter [Candidatus Dormibacteraeota bacterium]MBJ7613022.1 MFS transporter [Candidatus Dormibacteraeota bacterium]